MVHRRVLNSLVMWLRIKYCNNRIFQNKMNRRIMCTYNSFNDKRDVVTKLVLTLYMMYALYVPL
jgi:hypothetical protein